MNIFGEQSTNHLRYAVVCFRKFNKIPYRIPAVQFPDKFHSCLAKPFVSVDDILAIFHCRSLTGCTQPKTCSNSLPSILFHPASSQFDQKLKRGWHKSDRYREDE